MANVQLQEVELLDLRRLCRPEQIETPGQLIGVICNACGGLNTIQSADPIPHALCTRCGAQENINPFTNEWVVTITVPVP